MKQKLPALCYEQHYPKKQHRRRIDDDDDDDYIDDVNNLKQKQNKKHMKTDGRSSSSSNGHTSDHYYSDSYNNYYTNNNVNGNDLLLSSSTTTTTSTTTITTTTSSSSSSCRSPPPYYIFNTPLPPPPPPPYPYGWQSNNNGEEEEEEEEEQLQRQSSQDEDNRSNTLRSRRRKQQLLQMKNRQRDDKLTTSHSTLSPHVDSLKKQNKSSGISLDKGSSCETKKDIPTTATSSSSSCSTTLLPIGILEAILLVLILYYAYPIVLFSAISMLVYYCYKCYLTLHSSASASVVEKAEKTIMNPAALKRFKRKVTFRVIPYSPEEMVILNQDLIQRLSEVKPSDEITMEDVQVAKEFNGIEKATEQICGYAPVLKVKVVGSVLPSPCGASRARAASIGEPCQLVKKQVERVNNNNNKKQLRTC